MFNGEALRVQLNLKDRTGTDLADYLGINNSTLWRKMTGQTEFTRAEIQAIQKYLDLRWDEVSLIFFA